MEWIMCSCRKTTFELGCGHTVFFTPHAQRERGKVIGVGVHMFICLWTKKKFESYLSDWFTFSNLHSRTSRRIYRLAPENLSSLSKSRISIFNAHLTLFVRRMMSHNSIGKYRQLVNWLGTCIVTQGPVSIVCKLYQFQIVCAVVELHSVSYNSQFCPLAGTASLLLTTLSFVHHSHV